MEAKLKSTLKPIRWSLLLRAGVFGLAWLFLPYWLFFLVAIYFYCKPFFHTRRLIWPFVLTLFAAFVLPVNFWLALFLSALFYLIVGIKNLSLVDRFSSHQLLVFFLLFLIFLAFFIHFENWQNWQVSFWSLGLSLSFFLLAKDLVGYESEKKRKTHVFAVLTAAFFVWQASLVVLFLPLNYFYQTALLFLTAVVSLDLLFEYFQGKLDRHKILTGFSAFFVFTSLILASARWFL